MALSLAEIIILSLVIDWLFRKFRIPGLVGMLLLGIVFGPYTLGIINPELIAPLLAVMAIGFIILEKRETIAHEISRKLSKILIFAEILLFVMAGAQVNIKVVWQVGLTGVALLMMSLLFRSLGTYCYVLGSHLNFKERIFVVIAYMPKATVQAAIGAAPLAAMKLAGMNLLPAN